MKKLFPILIFMLFFSSLPLYCSYEVGPGDVLQIKVFEDPEVTGEFEVSPEGYINFPFIGKVRVEGLTPSQIEDRLRTELVSKKIYVNPHLSVSVKEYRSQRVIVLGEVEKPGIYSVKGNITLLDVISMCGGLTDKAGNKLILIRNNFNHYSFPVTSGEKLMSEATRKGKKIIMIDLEKLLGRGDLSQNYRIDGGDVVFIPQAGKVYVLGEVKKPGVYKYSPGLTALQVIVKAGGFTVKAAPSRVRIIRMEQGKEKVIYINMKKIINNEASDVKLQDGDVVVIPESYF